MDDITNCPICNNFLKNSNVKFLYQTNKMVPYAVRTCTKGFAHTLRLYTDKATSKVDLIEFSISPNYSKFIEINFIKSSTQITIKNNTTSFIHLDKVIFPDFPDLTGLLKQVDTFILLS